MLSGSENEGNYHQALRNFSWSRWDWLGEGRGNFRDAVALIQTAIVAGILNRSWVDWYRCKWWRAGRGGDRDSYDYKWFSYSLCKAKSICPSSEIPTPSSNSCFNASDRSATDSTSSLSHCLPFESNNFHWLYLVLEPQTMFFTLKFLHSPWSRNVNLEISCSIWPIGRDSSLILQIDNSYKRDRYFSGLYNIIPSQLQLNLE